MNKALIEIPSLTTTENPFSFSHLKRFKTFLNTKKAPQIFDLKKKGLYLCTTTFVRLKKKKKRGEMIDLLIFQMYSTCKEGSHTRRNMSNCKREGGGEGGRGPTTAMTEGDEISKFELGALGVIFLTNFLEAKKQMVGVFLEEYLLGSWQLNCFSRMNTGCLHKQ
jgi:hypothetical protein